MSNNKTILMADVVDSSHNDQLRLMEDFADIINEINIHEKSAILSPLTITLGDEFQAIIKDTVQAITVIEHIEETIIRKERTFKLRYVIVEGSVDTPINTKIGYGMLGDGLTRARKNIENLKKNDQRFNFEITNKKKENALNQLFIALQSIIDDWNPKRDYQLVSSFLQYKDYKQVASVLGKERSLMWKRNKSLKMSEYNALKEVANFIGQTTYA